MARRDPSGGSRRDKPSTGELRSLRTSDPILPAGDAALWRITWTADRGRDMSAARVTSVARGSLSVAQGRLGLVAPAYGAVERLDLPLTRCACARRDQLRGLEQSR